MESEAWHGGTGSIWFPDVDVFGQKASQGAVLLSTYEGFVTYS